MADEQVTQDQTAPVVDETTQAQVDQPATDVAPVETPEVETPTEDSTETPTEEVSEPVEEPTPEVVTPPTDEELASAETAAAAEDDQILSTAGAGVNAAQRNSTQAQALIDTVANPPGTVLPDASNTSGNTTAQDLASAESAATQE